MEHSMPVIMFHWSLFSAFHDQFSVRTKLCCFNVSPTSALLAQHWTNIGRVYIGCPVNTHSRGQLFRNPCSNKPSRQFLACDVDSTWIWGWNHVATSPNVNTTSYRRRISDVALTRKNDIITTSYRRHAWNDVEIRLKSRCICVEITLKLWRWNTFHLKPFFNVVTSYDHFWLSVSGHVSA